MTFVVVCVLGSEVEGRFRRGPLVRALNLTIVYVYGYGVIKSELTALSFEKYRDRPLGRLILLKSFLQSTRKFIIGATMLMRTCLVCLRRPGHIF